MIKVVAKCTVNENSIDEFKQTAAGLVAETISKDQGCVSYQLFQDIKDSKILTFIEEYENIDALKSHGRSTHFQTIFPKLEALCTAKIEVSIYKPAL